MDEDEGFHEFPEDLPFWYGTSSGVQHMQFTSDYVLHSSTSNKSTSLPPPLKLKNQDSVMQFFVPNGDNEQILEEYVDRIIGEFLEDKNSSIHTNLPEITSPSSTTTPTLAAMPDHSQSLEEFIQKLKSKVINDSTRVSSQRMIGHMTTALPYFHRPLAKLLTTLNQNVVKIETSSTMTILERETLIQLHSIFFQYCSKENYKPFLHNPDTCFGVFCSGGTVANITACWLARNKSLGPKEDSNRHLFFHGVSKEGLYKALKYYGYSGAAIVGSEMMHYSFRKAVDLLGLGEDGLIRVPVDEEFRIKLDVLEIEIQRLQKENICVLAIVGIAGTTESGSVDDLTAMSEIAKKYNLNFHVDAAWGGPLLFSFDHRYKLKGIEEADTITVDGHKQLYTPMGLGILLIKDPYGISNIKKEANYIIRKGSLDMGKFTLEGSRPANVLYLHASLHLFGKEGFNVLMTRLVSLTQQLAHRMKSHPSKAFQLLHHPMSNILLYRILPQDLRNLLITDNNPSTVDTEDCKPVSYQQQNHYNVIYKQNLERIDQLQVAVQSQLSKTFVSRTKAKFKGQHVVCLRIVIGNPLTEWSDVQDSLNEQIIVSSQIENKQKLWIGWPFDI